MGLRPEHVPAGAGRVACRRQPEGRHNRTQRERLPQAARRVKRSEINRERRRQPERSGDHPRDSAMVKGKVKRVAQGGQPERSGATSQHAQ